MSALIYMFSRFFNALIEARARQAEVVVRKHLALVPYSALARAGVKANYVEARKLPFVK